MLVVLASIGHAQGHLVLPSGVPLVKGLVRSSARPPKETRGLEWRLGDAVEEN